MTGCRETSIKRILAFSPAVIYACRADRDFGATFVSDNITPLFGYSQADCLESADFWRSNIHPEDVGPILDAYPVLFAKDYHVHEYRFRCKDGQYKWVRDEVRLLRDAEGNPAEIIGSWIDISERKEAETALRKSEALFREFFHANPVPTIVSSASGIVHMVNPAFTRTTGFSSADVIGKTAQEMGFWRQPEDRERMVAAIREHGAIDNLESLFFGKNQKPMTCQISSRAIELEGELRILSIVNDVTEQRIAEEALRKLDKAKSEFISAVAHELRTPLVAVIGYCELLEGAAGKTFPEEQRADFIAIIQSNAELLNRLVDDLLDIGRIQIGKSLGIVCRESRLAEVIGGVVDSLRLKSHMHDLVIVHDNPLPEVLSMDSGRIRQVLNNLIINAIKYSPHGGMIRVRTATGEDRVEVSVVDQGLGMTPQQVERIFDRFYRVDFSNAETSGLGLGMSIVKQIIQDHGGEVAVSSRLGEGTSVTFTLPIRR